MTKLALCAASGSRHARVPRANERRVLWIIAAPPEVDEQGRRYYKVVVDIDGKIHWPRWVKAYQATVELLSPEVYPIRTLEVIDPPHEEPRKTCAKCGRTFHMAGGRESHERVCGAWGRVAVAAMALAFVGCGPPAVYFQSSTDELTRAQERRWMESVTEKINALVFCADVQTRACLVGQVQAQKDGK